MGQKLIRSDKISLEPKLEAFPYQGEAIQSAVGLEYSAIFHEQGLGKTKIAIDMALIWLADQSLDSVVIVTKKGLVENWVREVKTHSKLRPIVIGSDKGRNYHAFNQPGRIYITHYEAVTTEIERFELFQKSRNVAFILDESQKIKNPESKIAKNLFKLGPGLMRRVIMTGTPVANRVFDIWSQIYFLDFGKSLGVSFDAFREAHDMPKVSLGELSDNLVAAQSATKAGGDVEAFEQNVAGVFEKLSTFSVRETKKGSGLCLPTKEIVQITADWEPRQLELYEGYKNELRETVIFRRTYLFTPTFYR